MKRIAPVLAMLLLASHFLFAQTSNLVVSPSQARPGDKIHIEYNPKGTVLGETNDFQAIAYIEDGMVRAQEIVMTRSGDKWIGDFSTNDTTKSFMVVFKKDELIDNN